MKREREKECAIEISYYHPRERAKSSCVCVVALLFKTQLFLVIFNYNQQILIYITDLCLWKYYGDNYLIQIMKRYKLIN